MELIDRVEVLEVKVAEIDAHRITLDGEVDAIQAIRQNKEKIIDLNQTVGALARAVKAVFIAGIGAGLIHFGSTQLQDEQTANDELADWTARGGFAVLVYSIVVLTGQEAIAANLISTVNPWKK